MTEWQPIGTAPKNGDAILIRSKAWGREEGYWITRQAVWDAGGWGGPSFYSTDDGCTRLIYAAQWRPLVRQTANAE